MVLLSVQGMEVAGVAKVAFTSPDRVREVINNFDEDGFDSLHPKGTRWSGRRRSRCRSARRSRRSFGSFGRSPLEVSTASLSEVAEFGVAAPTVVFSMDEFGPPNLLPREGTQWRRAKDGSTNCPRR
jgi:hypothetical protein